MALTENQLQFLEEIYSEENQRLEFDLWVAHMEEDLARGLISYS